MNINLFGSYHVFEAVRALGTKPVIVFSSSVAVYGGEVPDPIEDHTFLIRKHPTERKRRLVNCC